MFKREKKSDNQNGLIGYTNVRCLRIAHRPYFLEVGQRPVLVSQPVEKEPGRAEGDFCFSLAVW